MEPWYKVVIPRKEVREGRSFNPDEFAIALQQVIAGKGPEDYRKPEQFFSRTCFTKALKEHVGMVLRRIAGETANTAPVLTLVTQFGGGKTHALTALYHLVKNGTKAKAFPGISGLLGDIKISDVPEAKVAVFVGNAWDPQDGIETPWIDVARQLAGEKGVKLLGPAAGTTPPGTDALGKIFDAAGGKVLILFDEVLNFLNRHRDMAESFHAFIQNLTVAMTGTMNGAAVISLPRSQVEMTPWDQQWQGKITKVVRRVSKDLLVNDESEISEVVRRRLFEGLGKDRVRNQVARAFADWCFERRAQLPTEWTAVDTATSEKKAREFLQNRFESCYPFHPATLSVFQRKWQVLPQYQQTRGTLAMLAQWISWAYREGYQQARREPFVTLGSAPLHVSEFRATILGQLGENKLDTAIVTDIASENSHSKALDADTKGPLRDIHRRVGAAILFESSGGQVDKVAHLPELRFALGEPEIDTTSIDNAAYSLESKAFFVSRVGTDGFKIYHKATIRKAVNDRRASLDEDEEIKPTMRNLTKKEFEKGATIPLVLFPADGSTVQDSPRLTMIIMDPEKEWPGDKNLNELIAEWTKKRGESDRLYPGAMVWCFKKSGREFREKVELLLAWKRIKKEIVEGSLGADYDKTDHSEVETNLKDAEEAAKDEVWAGYRFVVLADSEEPYGLKTIDLGAGHSSAAETLCGRVITALKSNALLNESVGAGYIDRNWPPAFKDSGAWPLSGLRKSFLDGSLTRLLDPDTVLRTKIVEFVTRGDFGLASGQKADGTYERIWFRELVSPEEAAFEKDVFLLKKAKAELLKKKPTLEPEPQPQPESVIEPEPQPQPEPEAVAKTKTIRITGSIPPEVWNRLGTKIIPKLKSGKDVSIEVKFSTTVDLTLSKSLESELRQLLQDLGIDDKIRIE
jgi:hypothetical protein